MGAVTIAPDQVLLSYLGTDGSCHLAEIEFDAEALHDAAPGQVSRREPATRLLTYAP